jgi:hypothetical protein
MTVNAQTAPLPETAAVGVSQAHEALTELEVLLETERTALRDLDAETVLSVAEKKELILTKLAAEGVLDRPELQERLRALVVHLRHNGVLLAQARDVVRDAVRAGRLELQPGRLPTSPPRYPTGVRVSTRG